MQQQAKDLLEEGQELKALLDSLDPQDWNAPTPFKDWTVNKVIQHLHGSDKMAVLALSSREKFEAARVDRKTVFATMNPTQTGQRLLEDWWSYFTEMSGLLGKSDPDFRVPWFGPDMGVKMFTTARQMETWAHAQDIYDLKKQVRNNTDRIKNIAVIGVKTFGWTFANRKQQPPGPPPYVKLTAPSGEIWEFNEPSDTSLVEGSAVEFSHVVTQGRNIKDVDLKVVGDVAEQWMAIAQCFAGPPEDPPAPGSRASN
jgi:uncharacterized protein (TIGR03084 family)